MRKQRKSQRSGFTRKINKVTNTEAVKATDCPQRREEEEEKKKQEKKKKEKERRRRRRKKEKKKKKKSKKKKKKKRREERRRKKKKKKKRCSGPAVSSFYGHDGRGAESEEDADGEA
ncbi:hypothetical protein GBF38_009294 [Nibea albiflora]|uniref:Uncharacterized protein n=1 Tax=Nibea albiflora TaxID=240163 RepID=A0ACB7EU58_NIBAL|nr:hypothetical protein GBF38_009294 [Nibea albiflora]